jgi:uncharacterized membrane protein YraQ (UPF0718 family)
MINGNNSNPQTGLITFRLVLDTAALITMLTLAYWVGQEAQQVKAMTEEIITISRRLTSLEQNSSEIYALKEKNRSQDERLEELKQNIIQRLTRIETKLDR